MALRAEWLAIAAAAIAPVSAQILEGEARAVDGDTVEIAGRRLDLYGIDAMELDQTCRRRDRDWACGDAARRELEALVAAGTTTCRVVAEPHLGVTIARCRIDWMDLSAEMIGRGMAVRCPRSTRDFRYPEREARHRGAGIWSSIFRQPSKWRVQRGLPDRECG